MILNPMEILTSLVSRKNNIKAKKYLELDCTVLSKRVNFGPLNIHD